MTQLSIPIIELLRLELVIVRDSAMETLRDCEATAFAFQRPCSSKYVRFGSTLTISG